MSTSLAIITNNSIIYDINPEILIELKAEQEIILAAIPADIKDLDIENIKAAKRKVGKLRINTEAQRKEYKAAALSYGKLVDSLAEDAQKPVAEIENVYEKLITQYDEYFVEIRRLNDEKEAQRIANIQARIENIKLQLNFSGTSKDIAMHMRNLESFWSDDFNYGEFAELASATYHQTFRDLEAMLCRVSAMESDELRLEAQRKIDNDNRIKFEAERALFEANIKAENDRLAAERFELQKQKDIAEKAEQERLRILNEQQEAAIRSAQKEALEKQIAIEAEARKVAQEAEAARLKEIAAENQARKLAQEKEDRIRNAAPQLLEALDNLTEFVSFYSNPENITTEGEKNIAAERKVALNKAIAAIKLARDV